MPGDPAVYGSVGRGASAAAYSNSGNYLAIANAQRIWVFDAHTLEELNVLADAAYVPILWTWEYRYGLGNSLRFLSDQTIATAGMGAMLTFWDVHSGRRTDAIDWDPELGYPVALAYSETTGLLAAGTTGGVVALCWPGTSRQVQFLTGFDEIILSLLISRDGRYLAAAGEAEQVVVWDLESTQEIARLPAKWPIVDMLPFAEPGKILIAGKDLEIWNFIEQKEIGDFDDPNLAGQIIGSGALFALSVIPFVPLATSVGAATVAPAQLGLFYLPIPNSAVASCSRSVAISPDGSRVVDVHPGVVKERIRVIDAASGEVQKELNPRGGHSCDLEFSPDGRQLLVVNNKGGHVFDTQTWKKQRLDSSLPKPTSQPEVTPP